MPGCTHLYCGLRALALCCWLLVLVTPAWALRFERTMAPETDISVVGRVSIVAFESGQPGWADGYRIADRYRRELEAEGFLELLPGVQSIVVPYQSDVRALRSMPGLQDAQVIILGRVTPSYSVKFGQRNKSERRTIYRTEYDIYGRAKQVPYVETVQVPIRTESRKMELTLELRAIELSTGNELGLHHCTATHETEWEEGDDPGTPQSGMVETLLPKVLDMAVVSFSPYRIEAEHLWRPRRARDEVTQRAADAAEAGNYDQAVRLFKASIEVDPVGRAFEWGNLAIVYDAMGEYDEALVAIREGLRTSELKAELKDHESQLLRAYRGKVRKDSHSAKPETDQTVRVVDFTSAEVTFDGGQNRGWQVGAIVRIVKQVPVQGLSGEVLGHRESEIARVKLITVEDKFSVGQVLEIREGQELGLGLVAKLADTSG